MRRPEHERRPGAVTPALCRLLAAWLLSWTAVWMAMVGAGVFAFESSGARGVAAVTVARLAPAVVVAPLAGMLIDRVNRAWLLAAAAAVLGVGLAGAAIAAGSGSTGGLLLALLVTSAAATPVRPTVQAMLPALARTPGELTRAMALWSGFDSLGFLVGAGLGGLLALAIRIDGLLSLAALLAAATAALVLGLPANRAAGGTVGTSEVDGTAGLLAGARTVRDTPQLHAPMLLFVGLLLLEGTTDVQLVALTIGRLHLGSGGVGLLYTVWGIGGLLGGGALFWFVRRAGYGRALLVGGLGFGLALAVSGAGGVVVAVAAMIPVGLGFSLVEHAVAGVIPRLADDAVTGRVYGLCELLAGGVAAGGAALAAPLIRAVGVVDSLGVVGLAFVALVAVTAPPCLQLDRGEQVAGRVRMLLHAVPFLGALPLPQLERLVRSARPLSVPEGSDVVQAGDTGDDFFVLEQGEVEVLDFGRRLGPGDGFGEIALLRMVPRTATVRARSDTQLWTVGRASFLAAVTGDAGVQDAADRVVTDHLARPRSDARRPRPSA